MGDTKPPMVLLICAGGGKQEIIADVVFSRNDHFACQQEYSGVGFFRIGTWSQCGWGIILKNWALVGLGMFLLFFY